LHNLRSAAHFMDQARCNKEQAVIIFHLFGY
jgi:hypothetical protein